MSARSRCDAGSRRCSPVARWPTGPGVHLRRGRQLQSGQGLGGHGYGKTLHGPRSYRTCCPRPGEWPDAERLFNEELLVAVEPMINAGSHEVVHAPDDWPISTADGSLSVHYEADVLVTGHGPRNLTAGLFDLPDVVG